MNVAIIYNEPVAGKPDSEDVLDEVRVVVHALTELGHSHKLFPVRSGTGSGKNGTSGGGQKTSFSLNETIFYLILKLKKYKPDVIFNLVESINDEPVYQQFLPLLLDHLKYPFTGSGYGTILTTSDKSISKMLMKGFNILTPEFNEYRGIREEITVPPPWIVKPSLEDASVGIDESSVFYEKSTLRYALPYIYERHGKQPLIIEQYIQGREFNVSLLETGSGTVKVLPVSEIVFHEWPVETPMIVGYKAKWDKKSFEYTHTTRRFNPTDVRIDVLQSTALKCWKVFKLNGYARVDMRISESNEVYVLEMNANPCISPDSGFVAALAEAGHNTTYLIKSLIDAAKKNYE